MTTDLFTTSPNKETTDKTFHKSGKQDPFIHILKMLGSQFWRINTGIQLGPDVFDKSR